LIGQTAARGTLPLGSCAAGAFYRTFTAFRCALDGQSNIVAWQVVHRDSAKDASNHEVAMLDIAMLLLGFGSFALLIGYIPLCERL
jgi:hypothetical protein